MNRAIGAEPEPASRPPASSVVEVPRALVIVSIVMLVVRVAWVERFREIDSDAYGHFFIAIATRRDPTNLAVHWVWLPLYHFLLAGLHLGFHSVRLMNAGLTTLGPVLLFQSLRRRSGEREAVWASLAFALAPLTTILGQSAQPETLFAVLLLASVFEASRDNAIRAGLWLALACFVRYEAWGAALAASAWWAFAHLRARALRPPPFALVAIPALLVSGYVAFRWWTDGEPLLFLRGTRAITAAQVDRPAWTLREVISFPIVLPFIVLGPALLLVPFGLRRAFPEARDRVLPAGLAGFLLLSYYGGGAHSGERYLVSLVPFGCAAIGATTARLGEVLGPRRGRLLGILVLGSILLTTGWHLRRQARMAIAWDAALEEKETDLARLAR